MKSAVIDIVTTSIYKYNQFFTVMIETVMGVNGISSLF
ncbi:hypothetical protein yfred0001_22810 [Yersinia frederiksenii ATCC 33641]|nr:hypothetical protein yfred0001_22810 [Yersinia frederiksenii ATCC 33641]